MGLALMSFSHKLSRKKILMSMASMMLSNQCIFRISALSMRMKARKENLKERNLL